MGPVEQACRSDRSIARANRWTDSRQGYRKFETESGGNRTQYVEAHRRLPGLDSVHRPHPYPGERGKFFLTEPERDTPLPEHIAPCTISHVIESTRQCVGMQADICAIVQNCRTRIG